MRTIQVRNPDQLSTVVQKFLDEAQSSACMNIEATEKGEQPPKGFVQILFVKPEGPGRCPKCGVTQYSDSVFCHRCGTKLGDRVRKPEELVINFAYPYSDEPLELLKSKGITPPSGCEDAGWERAVRAALIIPLTSAQEITEFVYHLLLEIQGVASTSRVSVSIDYGY